MKAETENRIYISVEEGIEIIRSGSMLIMTDNEDRENEGDLVQAAELATAESVNFMAAFGRGLICMPVTAEDASRLGLGPMTAVNDSLHETAFTVSIDAREGITTGISAADRARTITLASHPESTPGDFVRPGHIFPLVAVKGGVLTRDGHTEASVDLARLSGLRPAAVICEIMSDDGTMARGSGLEQFASRHGLRILSIKRLREYMAKLNKEADGKKERLISTLMPTRYGEFALHTMEANRETEKQTPLFALVKGDISADREILVRIHSECATGDIIHSLRCDCGRQLEKSIEIIGSRGGVLLYMKQEGRGIGFTDKIKAYSLQDRGADTVEANIILGYRADERIYSAAASMLKLLGVRKLRLLTNNPEKVKALTGSGFDSVAREPLETEANTHNRNYLNVKREKLGHLLGA